MKINKLIATDKKLEEQFNSFERALENFCDYSHHKVTDDEKIRSLLEEYQKYCLCLRTAHEEKQEVNDTSENVLHKILFLPFLNLHDVIYLFKHIRKGSERWKEMSTVIREGGFELVLTGQKKHAEMKMLEYNDFKVEIFTEGWNKWRAMITKNFCIECWAFCCSCTEDQKLRDKLTESFGGMGFAYKGWESPSSEDLTEKKKKIKENYFKLIKDYTMKVIETGDLLKIGKQKNLDEEVEEITAVYIK